MRSLSKAQFQNQEDKVRKLGLMNNERGFVGNGFWWGLYPTYAGSGSGYGGMMSSAAPQEPVSSSGETATASDGAGVSAVGGMASN